MRKYPSNCMKLLPKFTVILTIAFSTSNSKQCRPSTTDKDGSVIIRNVGIKLCQLKCAEKRLCLSIQYNIDTLTCRLSRAESSKTKTKEGYVSLARIHSEISTGSCSYRMCTVEQRCLKTRSGKFICVQDEKESGPSQGIGSKQEIFVNSPLHDACKNGNLTRVRRILSQGLVDINSRDGNHGKTPLMVAAQEGHCRIFNFLIRKGANKSHVDNDGKNFLHWTCKGGHEGMVECVHPLYDPNSYIRRKTSLRQAIWWGYRDVYELLVCMGANVSQVNDYGDNLLHLACKQGRLNVVKYLLSLCSLDINSQGRGGNTPLMYAVKWRNKDICELLLSMGANLSQVDDNCNNVLNIASQIGELDLMKMLLSHGSVDINNRGKHGRTPLMNAVDYGNIKVFDLLVEKGGLTRLVDDQGYSILHLATIRRNVETVKHILSQNMADINARDKDWKTAAMIAKDRRYFRVYDLLVSRGCPVN